MLVFANIIFEENPLAYTTDLDDEIFKKRTLN
jgi:hypothetical protein